MVPSIPLDIRGRWRALPWCITAGKMKDKGEIIKVKKKGRKRNKECNTSEALQLERLLKGNESLQRESLCVGQM